MRSFAIEGDTFKLDGKDFKLISGAMHYFRIPREYWRDRLEKAKYMGCNTIETYIPWVLHEPKEGVYVFTGNLDLTGFVKLAWNIGLNVILRPGPFICGEFEFGALPWWLLKDRSMRVRSMHPGFLKALTSWFKVLLPMLKPFQYNAGGPVLMFQIENEYGYYSNNKEYPLFIKSLFQRNGLSQPFFTSDGPWGNHLSYGMLDGVLQTANFGSNAVHNFDKLSKLQKDKPLVCMEFWIGWFDAWGGEHHTRSAEDVSLCLKDILDRGHVNFYMLHGGTNFGWMSGANHYEKYENDVTSYDYDAPIAEHGMMTKKFYELRKVIADYAPVSDIVFSTKIRLLENMESQPDQVVTLQHWLLKYGKPVIADHALNMEELDQGFGYILYKTAIEGSDKEEILDLSNCNDRSLVYIDGTYISSSCVNDDNRSIVLPMSSGLHSLEILVENQGRVNFGSKMNYQRKGFDGGLRVSNCEIVPVEHYSLPFEQSPDLNDCITADTRKIEEPAFFAYNIVLDKEKDVFYDTFFDASLWGNGIVFVNGFNIGRFKSAGPQRFLYIPGTLLTNGNNQIIVFQTDGQTDTVLRLTNAPGMSGY